MPLVDRRWLRKGNRRIMDDTGELEMDVGVSEDGEVYFGKLVRMESVLDAACGLNSCKGYVPVDRGDEFSRCH